MKAVVWTDVFQSLVMIAGLLAIVIQVGITNHWCRYHASSLHALKGVK